VGEIPAIDPGIEQVGEPGGCEDSLAVLARRDDGRFHVGGSKGSHELDGGLISLHAMRAELVQKVLILPASQAVDAAHVRTVVRNAARQVYSARLEECDHAVLAWFPVDVPAIVHLDVERNERLAGLSCSLLKKTVEETLPRRCVDAGDPGQHAIQIEEDGIEIPRRQADGRLAGAGLGCRGRR